MPRRQWAYNRAMLNKQVVRVRIPPLLDTTTYLSLMVRSLFAIRGLETLQAQLLFLGLSAACGLLYRFMFRGGRRMDRCLLSYRQVTVTRANENDEVKLTLELANFAKFLASAGIAAGELAQDPEAWRGVTFGIVEAFSKWQLAQGYSIGTINLRLTTVKTSTRLAFKAGLSWKGGEERKAYI